MDRLRRSFRDSFRKRKEHTTEASRPHQWQTDEASVRNGNCNFHIKVSFHIWSKPGGEKKEKNNHTWMTYRDQSNYHSYIH